MRVTNQHLAKDLMYNLDVLTRRLDRDQTQLATGRQILYPGDDPNGTSNSLQMRTELNNIVQYRRNMEDGNVWLTATDAALEQLGTILQRARELAVAGANSVNPQAALDAIAEEVDHLLEGSVQVVNTTRDGRFLFGGHQTTAPPFTLTAGPPPTVTYNGDSGQIEREIDQGQRLSVNVTGDRILPPAPAGNLFDTLAQLASDLRAGNTGNISTTVIADLETHTDALLGLRAEVGAKMNRIEQNLQRLGGIEQGLQTWVSQVEDADLARVMIDLKQAEAAHQTALAVGARIVPPTLVDFLR